MTKTTEPHGDSTWFARLFGAPEADWPTTQARFRVEGEALHSLVNGRRFAIGRFATPTLAELRRETLALEGAGTLRVSHEVIGDVLPLHAEPANRGATFQVASQFNCLEFVSPDVTPEDGVTGYAFDGTQGPACALAAAAGTVFRNYAVPVGGAFGQRHDRQLDNLAEITARVPGIHTRNGYTRATPAALAALRDLVRDPLTRDTLLTSVQVGVQSRVGVTFAAR